jgi:hypothetical protein
MAVTNVYLDVFALAYLPMIISAAAPGSSFFKEPPYVTA